MGRLVIGRVAPGWRRFLGAIPALALVVAACASPPEPEPRGPEESTRAQTDPPVLNTYISDYIQIDQLGALPPDDANLFVGLDPADGSASVNKPPGPGTFIDWDDLAGNLANHQVLDLDAAGGKDPTSFPRSNECVGSSQVLSKMDLVYFAVANNNDYGYFAVARSNNNGDAGWYWLLTRKPPKLIPAGGPCKPNEEQLLYDISGPDGFGSTGDVLIAGHFKPNESPLVQVYQATGDMNNVDAVSAIDFSSGLWALHPTGVAAAAVNTTVTAPGALGSAGVIALTSEGYLEPEIFEEVAVPISVFTGGSVCGASFYGTVITRASGSGGTTPDVKDLAGPTLINFGNVEAQANLTATCTTDVMYDATALGPLGQPLENATCIWLFDTGETAEGCSGTIALSEGARSATVVVEDGNSACNDTVAVAPVQVYAPLEAQALCTPTCLSSFGYAANTSGGSGANSFAWTFSGGGSVNPASSTAASGSVAVGTGNVMYTADLTVTDSRAGGLECTAMTSCMTTPYAPLAVSLDLTDDAGQCPGLLDDAVVYTAQPSGGDGSYHYAWTGVACTGDMCEVDGDGQLCSEKAFHVTLTDESGLCSAADSETETYSKVTTINASDN